MYSLKNDYSEGAHPKILEKIVTTNLEQCEGYGEDIYCIEARALIKEKLENDNVDIHFIPGGTQTNLIAIASFLRPHEACIAANTGHIFANETGAIECTGHKVIAMNSNDGKLKSHHVLEAVKSHTNEHVVKPKLVYISNSTEIGTIYTKKELKELKAVCDEHNLLLFMDGARLGSALCSQGNDLSLNDISNLVDAFYIGGTKNGALLGEALVICKDSLKEDFRYHLKQRGAMLAKGRLLGIQFVELFKDNLFLEIGQHANDMANILRNGISELGYNYLVNSPSNQIFPIFPNDVIDKLKENYSFAIWKNIDDENTCIRLVTSWATKKDMVIKFVEDLRCISKN